MGSQSTHFVTIDSYNKTFILQSDRMAGLFLDVLQYYRHEGKMLVHEFVVMPNHVHILITPSGPIELAVKRIKGCFSTRAIKEFGFRQKVWQPSYYERRVRDSTAYDSFCRYIRENPVRARLVTDKAEWRFSSASGLFEMDPPVIHIERPKPDGIEDGNLICGV